MPTFTATLRLHTAKDAMGIEVPPDVVEALGQGKRAKVVVSLKGYSYRSTVAVLGGKHLLPLAKEHRVGAGVTDGEAVAITLEPDLSLREVAVPDDLATALTRAGLRAAFNALAFTYRKEHVREVEAAKKPETRQKRIDKVVETLRVKANPHGN